MSLYDAVKDLGTAVRKLDNAELLKRVADVQMEGAELGEENARLREENLALKSRLKIRDQLTFEDHVYWQVDGEKRHGPFCPACWDGDSTTLARMEDRPDDHWWRCTVCPKTTKKPGEDPNWAKARSRPKYEPFAR